MSRSLLPIAAPLDSVLLSEELRQNGEALYDSSADKPERGLTVFRARGSEIPNVLLELGRLREETFRTVGEGTGLERDNDRFDTYYDHYVCWDKAKNTITGAYRIGRVDLILREHGPSGVYTNTLFNLDSLFAADFKNGTLEAGRSFVCPEFQRGPTLLVIWVALARFIAAHPEYVYLMGPVSISNDFTENSKHLLVDYLMKTYPHEKSSWVTPKNPPQFESEFSPQELTAMVNSAANWNQLQEFVRKTEENPKAQIPQLIKLYLELGVKFLAFNKDDDFNSIDGLIWLDIPKIPREILVRYMGEPSYEKYHAFSRGSS